MSHSAPRKKWWELASTKDELDLFNLLARHPKYEWRTIDSVLKKLRWTDEHFVNVANPFIAKNIIIHKNSKRGFLIAYWERVNDNTKEKETGHKGAASCSYDDEDYQNDPNLI